MASNRRNKLYYIIAKWFAALGALDCMLGMLAFSDINAFVSMLFFYFAGMLAIFGAWFETEALKCRSK
jgi:hypothetical protein